MEPKKNNDIIVDSVRLRAAYDKLPPPPTFKSGYEGLDTLTGGFMPGELVVISGNQKSGKTTFCITLTKRFSEQDINCLWFSVEMPYRQFLECFGAKLPKFFLPLRRDTRTVEWIGKKIEEAVKKYMVKMVFIDHLGLITDEQLYYQKNAIDIVDERIAKLAGYALTYGVTIFVVSEHNKEAVKKSERSEMTTSGLRGTARLGYTASTVLGIERLQGVKQVRNWQDIEVGDAFLKTDMWIYVLESRKTGARKVRIKCYMDGNGDIREYES